MQTPRVPRVLNDRLDIYESPNFYSRDPDTGEIDAKTTWVTFMLPNGDIIEHVAEEILDELTVYPLEPEDEAGSSVAFKAAQMSKASARQYMKQHGENVPGANHAEIARSNAALGRLRRQAVR